MKRLTTVAKWFVLVLAGYLSMTSSALAWVVDPNVQQPAEAVGHQTDYYNPQTGEILNPVVLNQRLEERRLDTSVGIVDVPYSAKIVDSRPVDDWYERKAARATLIFKNDKMIRVEISE